VIRTHKNTVYTLHAPCLCLVEYLSEIIQITGLNRLANTLHMPLIKMQIMQGIKLGAEYFIALIQMMQIRATELAQV
jgi:hypothetical protein